tara:strand:- start:1079 stop:2257 length:1179 start_codon:yes stop_codon:yes gene_type:complete
MGYKISMDKQKYNSALEMISNELEGSRFKGDAVAILTHFLNTGHTIPDISEDVYSKIRTLHPGIEQHTGKFTFIDLFAGIGGFRLALSKHGGSSVFSSEWEKNAQNTYFSNYREMPFGDINLFTSDDVLDNELGALIPSHDILAAGFPCQPFSRAGVSARNSLGKKHGFECTTQGTLFYSIERIAKLKKPKVLFLENVKNLVSHDKGNTFRVIKETIQDLGYVFNHQIINSETVVPQRRERCFMVCVENYLHEEKGAFRFPDFTGKSLPLRTVLEKNPDASFTISDKLWRGHIERSKRNKERGTGFTTRVADLNKPSNTIVARYGKDGKECLIPQDGKNPRYLTVDECRLLFGYPKNFLLPDKRTPAYQLLGNSVVVPVVERIATAIIEQYF